jgi:hypothetical protein
VVQRRRSTGTGIVPVGVSPPVLMALTGGIVAEAGCERQSPGRAAAVRTRCGSYSAA